MKLFEVANVNISFWDAVDLLGLDKDIESEMHDKTIPWINNNSERVINTSIKNKEYSLLSKLLLFKTLFVPDTSFLSKTFNMAEFKSALNKPIKLWRGGGGTFNPDFKSERSWVPFTANKSRVETFSLYDGTRSSSEVFLPKRDGSYWVVELKCKLDDILLYLPHGNDEEVIIPMSMLKEARVIKQT